MDWASAPNFFREDIKAEEEEPTFMSLTSTKSGEEFDMFLDQLQDQFQDTLSSLLPFSLLSDVPSPEETAAAPTPVQPTPILDEVESPTNWGLNPHPVRNYNDDSDQPRLHFSSGEFDDEVDFRDPSSVSVSSSYRSSSPSSPRSMRTMSSRSSRTHSEATAEESAINAHIRNSQQAHSPFQLDEFVMYYEEPDTEEEDWPDNTSDSSESRRKRKRANSARAIIRKKTNSGQDQVVGTSNGRRNTSKKAQSQESADSTRRRQRPKPPKRERKRRDWVNHPRAHEISLHIYNFLVACRRKKEKPSAADIFHANPEIFIEFGINEADKNKIGEHLRDIYRGRSTDPAGLLTKEVVWDLWYDQTRVTSSTRRV